MLHKSAPVRGGCSPRVGLCLCLFGILTGLFVASSSAQVYQPTTNRAPANPATVAMQTGIPQMRYPQASSPTAMTAVNFGQPNVIEPATYAPNKKKPNKPLPYPIISMPQVEEELEVIHHRSQLVVTRARIARWAISDPSIIDILQYSPTEISIIGLQLGVTHLTLWFEGEKDPLIYRAEVIRDPNWEDRRRDDYGRLERQLQVLFPNSQVFLIPLTWRLIVKGQARDQEEAAQIMNVVRAEWMARNADGINGNGNNYGNGFGGYGGGVGDFGGGQGLGLGNNGLNNNNQFVINMLEIPGEQQLMIHVRIAQLDRAQLRRFGIDLNYLINHGRHAVAATVGGAASTLSGIFENGEVSVLVDWLASNRTAKILAEPTITVLSGHSASFLSGGEFAVPTIVGVAGAAGTSTTFRGFGTSLIVTPTIIDKDLIRMRIVPEFSAINAGNTSGGVPGLDTRRATTTIQLREGQTIALAGLFSSQSSVEVTRIPFLGELPFIGPRLFNAKQATQGETELLFLVTPQIVRPMEQDEVPPVPGFYVTHPNDKELYHYAMTEGAPDEGVYQLAPYGWGPGMGTEIGYRPFNPELTGPFPPGPQNGLNGCSLPAGVGGFSLPGAGMPSGLMPGGGLPPSGYSVPMAPVPAAPASNLQPQSAVPPEPAVRYSPNTSRNPLLSRSSAEDIANRQNQQKMSWNPFHRVSDKKVQPAAGNETPSAKSGVRPAEYQPPRQFQDRRQPKP